MNIENLPNSTGAYALILRLDEQKRIRIGKLGEFDFPKGDYVYFGSAKGGGGIRARLGRHLIGSNQTYWHIDYLRQKASVVGFCTLVSSIEKKVPPVEKPLECIWSNALSQIVNVRIVAYGFGASDCVYKCPAHLFYISNRDWNIESLRTIMAYGAGIKPEHVVCTKDAVKWRRF